MNDAKIIAELICRRIAEKNKLVLGDKFWNEDYWGKEFKKHIIAAHSLLKIYPLSVIINALKDKRAYWITSLRCKQLHDICKEYSKKLEYVKTQVEESKKIETTDPNILPPTSNKQSKFDKLK